jgi:L-asparaginase
MMGLALQLYMPERVLVLSTGGTIASTAGENGASPTKAGEQLVEAVPELDDRAEVEHLAQRPSPDMDFEVLERLRDRAADHDAGVVVTHGTDTMAESAYYVDLVRDWDVPVVFTGAQRRPDQLGSNGPANILDAVSVAEEPAVRSAGGVYVCLNGEVHAVRDAVKAHTWRPDTFESPGKGPVGAVAPDGFERYRELGSDSVTLPDAERPSVDVPIVTTAIGVDRAQVDRAVDAGCDGLILQTTGLGNAPESVADAVGDAIEAGVPVVVTSRCHAGGVAAVYGGGGGYTLEQNGAVLGGDFSAPKARIKLLVALAADAPVADAFADD